MLWSLEILLRAGHPRLRYAIERDGITRTVIMLTTGGSATGLTSSHGMKGLLATALYIIRGLVMTRDRASIMDSAQPVPDGSSVIIF